MFATKCYDTNGIRAIEQTAILDVDVDCLMERAGNAVFRNLLKTIQNGKIIVFCGPGNNGGDGYIVARLAHDFGFNVSVFYTHDPMDLPPPALNAYKKAKDKNVKIQRINLKDPYEADVIIDAVLGIGITRNIEGFLFDVVKTINDSKGYVISIDVPTGINSDNGNVMGVAVQASKTITFIGNKIGLITGDVLDYCGEIVVDRLDLVEETFSKLQNVAELITIDDLKKHLLPRNKNSHKGTFGHVVVIGGDEGMAGAVIMAATAALCAGAGSVTIVTHHAHANEIYNKRPEIMVHAVSFNSDISKYYLNADVVVFGPGMSLSKWSQALWQKFDFPGKVVLDAGGLRLLAKYKREVPNWILTPHPGEAASLLDSETKAIQKNRYLSVRQLIDKYKGTVILKGAGSIICSNKMFYVCNHGNSGMSTAGMGDVLSGIIAAFVANGLNNDIASRIGVLVHAIAGDNAAGKNPKGLLSMDLMEHIKNVINMK